MSKKTPLRNAINAIEAGKPLVLHKFPKYTPPPSQETAQGKVDPWKPSVVSSSLKEPAESLAGAGEQMENKGETNPLTNEVPDNRDTENPNPAIAPMIF